MNPAPPKPPSKNADRKALAAYYSELRRWAKALEQWEADLDDREAAFEQALDEVDDETVQQYAGIINGHHSAVEDEDEDEMDCDCDAEAAAAGCDCSKCEMIRKNWVAQSKAHKKAGDEVAWLEDLWNLEDKRK